jgi:hypothetical protein
VERHLERCRSCRDELGALRRFSPEALASAAAPGRAAPRRTLREVLAPLGRLAWQPGFAYLLVGLLLLPAIYRTFERSGLAPGPAVTADAVAPTASPTLHEPAAEQSDRELPPAEPRALRKLAAEDSAPAAPPAAPRARRESAVGESDAAPPLAASRTLRESAEEESLRVPPPALARAKGEGRVAKLAGMRALRSLDEDALLDIRPSAAAPAETAGVLAASARKPVRLQADRTVEVAAAEIAGGLRLLVPLPAAAGEEGEAEIRVSDPTGRRQLRELRAVGPAAHSLEMDVPAEWLAPGVFRVEIRWSQPDGHGGEPEAYAFSVRGPLQ